MLITVFLQFPLSGPVNDCRKSEKAGKVLLGDSQRVLGLLPEVRMNKTLIRNSENEEANLITNLSPNLHPKLDFAKLDTVSLVLSSGL